MSGKANWVVVAGWLAWGAVWAGVATGQEEAEIVVYGGTSGGVAAAIAGRRMGKSVLIVEPSRHIGGLTSGGLGATDIGNKRVIGGVSREFYRRVKGHYDQEIAWRFERPGDYRDARLTAGDDAFWTFEPHVAEAILRSMLAEAGVPVVFGERLNRATPLPVQSGRIAGLPLESGRIVSGRMFIDATYEGDLMAAAGVDHHVGREANAAYGETLNGVQAAHAIHHQLPPGVDPYVRPGDPASGLLPGVHGDKPGEDGSGDPRVQAYCFRMCLTDVEENRIPFERPADYDPLRYELLLRDFEAGQTRVPWSPTRMPNRKTDTNNRDGFSTDYLHMNYEWPEGDAATRERIFREHLSYQQGLMWALANHPRVPEAVRAKSRGGACVATSSSRDEAGLTSCTSARRGG